VNRSSHICSEGVNSQGFPRGARAGRDFHPMLRNRIDARAVCGPGRSNRVLPSPDRPLMKPRSPHRGFFRSATLAGHHHICIEAPTTGTDELLTPLGNRHLGALIVAPFRRGQAQPNGGIPGTIRRTWAAAAFPSVIEFALASMLGDLPLSVASSAGTGPAPDCRTATTVAKRAPPSIPVKGGVADHALGAARPILQSPTSRSLSSHAEDCRFRPPGS
jgi:hypothetical protein